jgi:Down-regulated in metastasis
VIGEVDLHRVVPPKRLSSAVQLANVVLAQLGQSEGGMAECAQILLRVQLVVAAQVSGLMRRKHEVSRSAIVAFRTTRKLTIDGIAKVFSRDYHGDSSTCYNWTPSELDAVFDAVVWPSIEVLHLECVAVPTALLKLFGVWAGNTKYFQLLVKHKEGDEAIHPLAAMIRLLNANVKGQVVSAVLDMLVFLLTLSPDCEENDEDLDDELENVTNVLPVDEDYEKKIQGNFLLFVLKQT